MFGETRLVAIEKVETRPAARFADPYISFRLSVEVGGPHIVIYPSLTVEVCVNQSGEGARGLGVCILGHETRPEFQGLSKSDLDFLLPLTPNVVRRIEEARTKEGKGNIHLRLILSGSVLLVDLQARPDPLKPKAQILVLEMRQPQVAQRLNATVVTRISSSDWVTEYQSRLGLGKFVLLEVPLDMEDVAARLEGMKDRELTGRVVDAARMLEQANHLLREGRWRDSVRQARDALEILEKGKLEKDGISVTQGVKDIIERAGLPEAAGNDLVQVIGRLYSFASATHPVTKKEQTVDLAVFDREDAVFVLTCIASIISMIAKKLERET